MEIREKSYLLITCGSQKIKLQKKNQFQCEIQESKMRKRSEVIFLFLCFT